MKEQCGRLFTVMAAVLFLSITTLHGYAEARAGGGRSYGGSRAPRSSYSRPAPAPYQSQPRQQYNPAPQYQQPQSGGFMRSMAGGLMGGMLGSMLFSGMAGAGSGMGMGPGAGMGGGIGLFEILLLAGGGYLLYRYMKKKRSEPPPPYGRY